MMNKHEIRLLKFSVVLLVILISICVYRLSEAATLQTSWNANTESDLAGYYLYYKPTGAADFTKVDVKNVTTYQVLNVLSNQEYCGKVSAYDKSGNESAASDILCAVLDTIPPAKPTGFKLWITNLLSWLHTHWS